MDTKIFRNRQNDREALLLQASARYYYEKSEKLDSCSYLTMIFLIIVQLLCKNEVMEIFLIVYFFIEIYIKYKIDYFINKGADLKLVFDEYVFIEKKIPNSVIQEIRELSSKNNTTFTSMINHNGTEKIRGVRDWYSSFVTNKVIDDPIKLAQEENIYFDKNFRFRYTFHVIFYLILGIIFFSVFKNESFVDLLKSLFITFVTPITKLIEQLLCYLKVKDNYKLFDNMINSNQSNMDIQRIIDTNRRIKLFPLDNVYSIFRKKLHSNFDKYKNLF